MLFNEFIHLLSKRPNIKLPPQLSQTPRTQTIIKPLCNIIPMTLLQLYRFTLAFNNIPSFTLKARITARATFNLMFVHIVAKAKATGFLPSQE